MAREEHPDGLGRGLGKGLPSRRRGEPPRVLVVADVADLEQNRRNVGRFEHHERRLLERAGAEVIAAPGRTPGTRLAAALDELGRREIQDMLVEGGPMLAGSLFDAGEIDELRLFIAPILVGAGKSSFGYIGLDAIAGAHGRWRATDGAQMGVDRLEVYERVQT